MKSKRVKEEREVTERALRTNRKSKNLLKKKTEHLFYSAECGIL